MSENVKTTLEEGINEINIEGILKEKKLEKKIVNGKECIAGELIITDGNITEHRVEYFANKVTKAGALSSTYKGLETVMETYLSIAEALNNGVDEKQAKIEATKIRIERAKIVVSDYEGKVHSKIRASFPPKSFSGTLNPKAEFEVEIFFENIRLEYDKEGIETGRVVVDGILPQYNGTVVPIRLIGEDAAGQHVLSNYEKGKTALLTGNVVNTVEHVVKITEGFGGIIDKSFDKRVTEFVFTNGSPEQYDEEDKRTFPIETVRKAMMERTVMLENNANGSSKAAKENGFAAPVNKRDLDF